MISKSFISKTFYLFIFSFLLLYIYQYDIVLTNSSSGYNFINFDFKNILIFFLLIFLLNIHFPKKITKPSDFFFLFYILIVLLPNILFSSGFYYNHGILLFIVIYFPLILIELSRKLKVNINILKIFTFNSVAKFLTIVLFFLGLMIYQSTISIGSFDYFNSYERRLLGREIFSDGTFVGYLTNFVYNSITPFVAFHSGNNKQNLLFVFTLLFGILSYWAVGLKSLFFYVIAFYFLGVFYYNNNLQSFSKYLILSLIFISLFSIIEFFINDYSIISQLILRRVFIISPHLQSFYFNEILSLNYTDFWFGINLGSQFSDITYLIGNNYLGNEDLNANTNTFLYNFLKYGFIGYFFNLIFVVLFFNIIDNLYRKNKNSIFIFLSCLFSILICEKSYTTSIVSSGIFIFLFFAITSFNKKTNE